MPEGHILHRAATQHTKLFAGRVIDAESPQGRFDQGAERLSGQTVAKVDAHGKHLFWRFDSGDVLHIHLGLYGKFLVQTAPFPEPSPNARVLLSAGDDRIHLAGPTACDILDEAEADAVVERLGPDPLHRSKKQLQDGERRFADLLARRRTPIGRAMLDQKVIAGLGNIYRAEILFLAGLHPMLPANEVDAEGVAELWQLSVDQLRLGQKSGRIVTVDPAELGASSRAKLSRSDSVYVYKRHDEPCRRCGALVRSASMDQRTIWWCPQCQPEE